MVPEAQSPESEGPREDRSISMVAANAFTLVVFLPLVAALVVPFVLIWGWEGVAGGAAWWFGRPLVLFGVLAAGVLAHESLHALTWRAAGVPAGTIRLGFQWKTLTPFAHCAVPMTVRAYRRGAAAPGLVLGLVPVLAALATGSGVLLAFGLFFTLTAGGDALVLWLVRGVPGHRFVEDHPTRAGCFVFDAADDALWDDDVEDDEAGGEEQEREGSGERVSGSAGHLEDQ